MSGFVTEPRVEMIGKPVIEIAGVMRFLEEHGYCWEEFTDQISSMASLGDKDAEWICEFAGRNCYQSWPDVGCPSKGRTHDDHLKHLIEVGHGACIEHANFTFIIWNVSRSLSHELVRHRLASYSQLSQRYVDSSNVVFVVPPAIAELEKFNPEAYRNWIAHCEKSRQIYEELTSSLSDMYTDVESKLERRKMARQAARSVLPNATETKITVTMNARAVRHLIELRASSAADVEIRAMAVQVYNIFVDKFPLLAHGMDLMTLPDGTMAVSSEFRRV